MLSFPFMLRNLPRFPSRPLPRQLLPSLLVLMQTLEPCITSLIWPNLVACYKYATVIFMYHTALFKVLTEHVPLPRREKKWTTIKTTHHPSFFPSLHFCSCNKKRLFTSSITHDSNQADITSEYNGEPNELLRVWQGVYWTWGIWNMTPHWHASLQG